jgi:riboflavin-specific deaminase-like protein
VVIFTTLQTSKSQLETLRTNGVEVYVHDAQRVDLQKMLETLGDLGVKRLMVEGGSTINFELLRLKLVDELMIYIAPMIFGGDNAPTLASGLGLVRKDAIALNLINIETHEDGGILLHYTLQVPLKA